MAETFKERMLRLRKRAGYRSQKEAAEAIGCERGTVGMWEAPSSGVDSVGGEYLLKVARAYMVRPEYLNTGKGDDGFPWDGGESLSVILDPEIVADVAQSLHEVFSELGQPPGVEHYPDLFVQLYQEQAKAGSVTAPKLATAVANWSSKHGARDERVAAVPASGTHSGNAGGRRKARR